MMNRSSTFAHRLAALRQEQGLTLEELAKKTGFPPQTLNRWERGERIPKVDAVASVANAMGVSVLWLFGYDVPQQDKPEKPGTKLTPTEQDLVSRFRQLDQRGRSTVLNTLDFEYAFRSK